MASNDQSEEAIRRKFSELAPYLNERTRRMWAATEAHALGFGGVVIVARATGLTRDTVSAGLQELTPRFAPLSIDVVSYHDHHTTY